MSAQIGFGITLIGLFISLALKYFEFRFAIAREKHNRQLTFYEELNLYTFRLAMASVIDPKNEAAKKSAALNCDRLMEYWLRAMPFVPVEISEKISALLTLHTVVQADWTSRSAEILVQKAINLIQSIGSKAGKERDVSALERFLLGKRAG